MTREKGAKRNAEAPNPTAASVYVLGPVPFAVGRWESAASRWERNGGNVDGESWKPSRCGLRLRLPPERSSPIPFPSNFEFAVNFSYHGVSMTSHIGGRASRFQFLWWLAALAVWVVPRGFSFFGGWHPLLRGLSRL